MLVQNNLVSRFTLPSRVSLPGQIASSLPTATETMTYTAPPAGTGSAPAADEKKKMYRSIAWAGFGIEMIGGGLVLAGHGGIGLTLAAIGGAAIVYGEAKARQH